MDIRNPLLYIYSFMKYRCRNFPKFHYPLRLAGFAKPEAYPDGRGAHSAMKTAQFRYFVSLKISHDRLPDSCHPHLPLAEDWTRLVLYRVFLQRIIRQHCGAVTKVKNCPRRYNDLSYILVLAQRTSAS